MLSLKCEYNNISLNVSPVFFLREREGQRQTERECARRELDMSPHFFNWYTDFWRQFFGTICFYEDSLPTLLFLHGPLLWNKIVKMKNFVIILRGMRDD